DECPACQTELEALYQRVARLKALPPLGPARDRWPAIRDAIVAERRRRVRRWSGVGLAAAAAVAGLIVLAPFRPRQVDAAELARAKQQSATWEEELPRPPRAPRAPRGFAFSYSDNRGRIGVVVRTDASPESDKLGAKLEAVTPGGPAEKAGLKAGDIITKFNGTGLAGVKSEDEDESGPGKKLIELARKLAPGDTVQIEYRRGGDTKTATLVAEDIDMAWSFVAPHIAPTPMPHLDGPEMMMEPRAFGFCFGDSWCELDLVTLNGDLGEYFGTKEGILVVKAPADSSLPLRAGDVILS